jgi:hypothetical protein
MENLTILISPTGPICNGSRPNLKETVNIIKNSIISVDIVHNAM